MERCQDLAAAAFFIRIASLLFSNSLISVFFSVVFAIVIKRRQARECLYYYHFIDACSSFDRAVPFLSPIGAQTASQFIRFNCSSDLLEDCRHPVNMARTSDVVCLLLLLSMVVATTGMIHPIPRLDHRHHLRQRHYASFFSLGLKSLVCIPTAIQTIEDHEGRHTCAYDHPKGFRAVGVGYNLDADVETRKAELSRMLLDYDKVYSGDSCLWDIQITTLVTLDAQRALNKAAEDVETLDDFCCDVQAVFADIQHSIGASKSLSGRDLRNVVERAALGEWTSAADELKQSDWCYDNKQRCDDNVHTVKSGCNKLSG